MNRLYLLSWYYQGQDGESDARGFFGKLREGIEKGKKFPFDCPSEVGLVHCKVDEHWCVGVLVMRGTEGDDSIEQTNRLHKWFEECDADFSGTDKTGERVSHPSVEGTLQSRYGSHYTCVEVFDPLSIVPGDKERESESKRLSLENLNPEDKAIATDLISLGDDDPDVRYKAYNVLDQKRYKDDVLLSGISRIEAEIPSNDVVTRIRLYCGLGVWLGGNIYSRPLGMEKIRTAIKFSPNMALPHTLLGTLLMGDSSNVYLERGTSSFREHPGLSDGELELLSKEFHNQAQEELELAIRLNPDDPTPYYVFCKSPFLDFSQLKNQYLQGVQRDKTRSPEFGENHWSFAMKAAKFNQASDATDAFLRAMIVSPQEYCEGTGSVRPQGGLALSCWQTAKQQIASYRDNVGKIDTLWLVGQAPEVPLRPNAIFEKKHPEKSMKKPKAVPQTKPPEDGIKVQEKPKVKSVSIQPPLKQALPETERPKKNNLRKILIAAIALCVLCICITSTLLIFLPQSSPKPVIPSSSRSDEQSNSPVSSSATLTLSNIPTPIPPTSTPPPLTATSIPIQKPKAGQWEGGRAYFIVTEDGQIQNLNITTEQMIGTQKCKFYFETDIPIDEQEVELKQALEGQTVFTITLKFETETAGLVSYSAKFCPNPAGFWFGPPQEGTYFVAWKMVPTVTPIPTPPTIMPSPTSTSIPTHPTYAEVLQTYPTDAELCQTEADIVGGGDEGLELSGTISMRNMQFVYQCYGTKLTVKVPVTLDGKDYELGTKLTVDKNLNWIAVSSWDGATVDKGTTTAGDVLLYDDFGSNANDWWVGKSSKENSDKAAEIADGKYRYSVTSKKGTFRWNSLPNFTAKDFLLSVDVTLLEASGGQPGGTAGGFNFRVNENEDYYRLAIYDDNHFKVSLNQGGEWQTPLYPKTANSAINLSPGVVNNIVILVKGSTFTFYANGQELVTVTDTTLSEPGKIGLGVELDEGGQTATVEFDNLVIKAVP